ncbi:MAG: hypothetical protein J2P50_18395 [Hyphomicrobiaceae bacterium]|nr:hypothetical protein [Hyphomicrobiaceae bacterium]
MTDTEIAAFYDAVLALGLRQRTPATWVWVDGSTRNVMAREELARLTPEQGRLHLERIRDWVDGLKEKS